MGDTMRP